MTSANPFGHPPSASPWLGCVRSPDPRGEAVGVRFDCVLAALVERAAALGLRDLEVAGIVGISETEWRELAHGASASEVRARLDRPARLLCELLGSVLAFAGGPAEGGRWLRRPHAAMGDSPLGRLIRSPGALAWLSGVLFDERAE